MTKRNPASQLRRSREEPAAFIHFYEDLFDPVLAYLARRIRDEEVALDLAAETFAQAYAARGRFRGTAREEAEAWVFQIAKRQLGRYMRRGKLERKALKRLGIEVPDLDGDRRARIEELAGLDGFRCAVRSELARLPESQREALRLRVIEELGYPEVAGRLRITEQAARLRVSRGLRSLAAALEANPKTQELIS